MFRLSISLLCFLISIASFAQSDSTFSSIKPIVKNKSWNIRFNTGIQRSYFLDIGISRSFMNGSGHGNYGYDYFASAILYPTFKKEYRQIYGLKAGVHFFGNGGLLGLETVYLSDGKYTDFIITPQIGIGLSFLYFSYGYGFSTNEYVLNRVGKHQFSLALNIPFKFKNLIEGGNQ